jgi:hypothetical protein
MFGSKLLARIRLGFNVSATCIAVGLSNGLTANVLAQAAKPTTESQQALQELRQDTSGDVFGSNSGSTGLLQLIHNANLLNGKSQSTFRSEQSDSIDQSVKQFRDRQRQKLGTTTPEESKTK